VADDRDRRSALDDLEQRIRAARGPDKTGRGPDDDAPARGAGMGLGMRISVELVVTVAVGAGIGYMLDAWLGTAPWLMIVFLFLGGAAGVSNVYRVVQGLDDSVGLGRAIEAKRRRDAAGTPGTGTAPNDKGDEGPDRG